jgi:rhodanese-related sulfurtransferase
MRRALGSSSFEEGPQVGAIDVAAVQQLLQAGDDAAVQLIDVREEEEHATASLPGFQLLPLSRYRATFLTV